MIRLIVFILILVVGVLFGLSLEGKEGVLIIAYQGKSYEMALWLGGLIVTIAFLVLYYALKFIGGFFNVGHWISETSIQRKRRKARAKTNQGLIELAEGQWVKAEKHLLEALAFTDTPLVNYLSLARAAQEQGSSERRDHYLSLAHKLGDNLDHNMEIAVGLTQVQLGLKVGEYEQSLAILKRLKDLSPHHPLVLKGLKDVYIHLKDRSGLVDCWSQLPKELQKDRELIFVYASALQAHNQGAEAEVVLRNAIKKLTDSDWSEALIQLYGQVRGEDPHKQLTYAEGWSKNHPKSPGLWLTLGRLSNQNQLWEKAQHYLEESLKIEDNPEAYAELGLAYEKMQKPHLSSECFRKGLLQGLLNYDTNTVD